MHKLIANSPIFLLSLALASQAAHAETGHNPHAHTHGIGDLSIAYESGQLLVELEAPAANFLGFEHQAETDEELQKVTDLRKVVVDPSQIFTLSPTCDVVDIDVDVPFSKDHDDDEKHHDHEHDDHHNKGEHHHDQEGDQHHDKHEGHDDDKDHDEKHQDIELSYEFSCQNAQPSKIELQLFSLFPKFEKLNAQWVINGKQGASVLTPDNTSLEISK